MKTKIKWFKLLISIVICNLAGILGSLFTASSVNTWYQTLTKPFFTPPGWIFGPAWTILYSLMGVSLYLIWENGFEKNKKAISVFGVQLGLNAFWSIIFFGLKSPFYAFIEIVFLWILILFTILEFYKIKKKAAYLLIPYITWVTFAGILNLSIVLLN